MSQARNANSTADESMPNSENLVLVDESKIENAAYRLMGVGQLIECMRRSAYCSDTKLEDWNLAFETLSGVIEQTATDNLSETDRPSPRTSSALGAGAAAAATAHTQIYLDTLAAYERWIASCESWSDMCPTHPDHERLNAISGQVHDEYYALLKKCCADHEAAPSLVGLGEINALWAIRCWAVPEGPDQMNDEFEAKALRRIIEALTGISAPKHLLG